MTISAVPRLLLLSPDDPAELTEQLSALRWEAVVVRGAADAERRFLDGGLRIVLADARGVADKAGLMRPLADVVEAAGGAFVVIADDIASGRDLFALGATHVITANELPDGIGLALMGATELERRLGNGATAESQDAIVRRDSLRWTERHNRITLSAALADKLGLPDQPLSPSRVIRALPRTLRRGVLLALRREDARDAPEGFLQDIEIETPTGEHLSLHLRPEGDFLVGEVDLGPPQVNVPANGMDYLTGLTNRPSAISWLEKAVSHEHGAPFCLVLGISQFDSINEAYGQAAGDAILARIARRIAATCRDLAQPGDLIARIAGTEFLVGLRCGSDGASRLGDTALFLAQQLVANVSRPFAAGDHLIQVTARCGIAEGLPDDDAARLLRRAAAALADARKSSGRDICLRTADRKGRGIDHDRLDADLRLAVGRGEIAVIFQPQYDIADDSIVGVEALARWKHPRLGQLGAAVLFGAAERSDTLLPLSRHIQSEALRLASEWPQSLAHLRLSINVTSTDLAQPDFLSHFLALADQSGFPPSRITLEITESGLIENIASASALLSEMRREGLRVAIDDFGTGYSSLAYLKAIELDYLKIDSGLTRDIAGAPKDRIIVRGIIAMAKSLSLTVVAEGVEHERQLDLLAREGCDLYQGFLRSAAMSNEELIMLTNGSG